MITIIIWEKLLQHFIHTYYKSITRYNSHMPKCFIFVIAAEYSYKDLQSLPFARHQKGWFTKSLPTNNNFIAINSKTVVTPKSCCSLFLRKTNIMRLYHYSKSHLTFFYHLLIIFLIRWMLQTIKRGWSHLGYC